MLQEAVSLPRFGSGQLAKVRLVEVGSAVAVDLEEVVGIGPCELEGGARNQAAGLDGSVEAEQDAVLSRTSIKDVILITGEVGSHAEVLDVDTGSDLGEAEVVLSTGVDLPLAEELVLERNLGNLVCNPPVGLVVGIYSVDDIATTNGDLQALDRSDFNSGAEVDLVEEVLGCQCDGHGDAEAVEVGLDLSG